MMGRTSDHLAKGLSPEEVCSAEDWERARREIGEVFDGKSVLGLEYHLTKSDGSSLPVMTYASPIMREGRIVGVRGVGVDVSELKAIQKQLMASLKEKEVLLREIHHRVKNNLQVVCSLLRVQRRSLENAQQAAMFQESENRIVSMATVYEKLYQSSNLSELNAGEYLSSLVRNIQGSYEAIGRGIELRTELEDVILNPDSAIPLGLIATELVSNCLKHAFPNPVNGRIQVSLRSVNDTRVELKVRDNGIGLPERTDAAECTSLGLRLVGIFVQQLGGELQISRDAGTAISVRFEKATMETG
jgi:two-component sensor histidine kinase